MGILTEAEHNVKENHQQHRGRSNRHTQAPQPERAGWDILPTRKEMRRDCHNVRARSQNNKRARKV